MNIRFWGMMRSGHHAVINWLMHEFDTSIDFINDALRPRTLRKLNHNKPQFNRITFANVEDLSIDEGLQRWKRFQHLLPTIDLDLIIVRDVKNLWASRIKYAETGKPMGKGLGDDAIAVYKDHFSRPHISYNQWHIDPEYRQEICNQLHLTCTDKAKDTVPSYGGGSSFNNRDVLNRWQEYQDNPYWQKAVNEINTDNFSYSRSLGICAAVLC